MQNFYLYYGDAPDTSAILIRKVELQPVMTDRLKISILEGQENVLMKLDVLGLSSKRSHLAFPLFQEKNYTNSKYQAAFRKRFTSFVQMCTVTTWQVVTSKQIVSKEALKTQVSKDGIFNYFMSL